MLYHITYRTRDGRTEVGRVSGDTRSQAMTSAAIRFGVPRSSITSAVALPKPRTESSGSDLVDAMYEQAKARWARERQAQADVDAFCEGR